jgi:hypothetical protein
MTGQGSGRLTRWESTEASDVFEGHHDGYHRLDPPLTHRRKITFDKVKKTWLMYDSVFFHDKGSTIHYDIESFFHLGEAVREVMVSKAERKEFPELDELHKERQVPEAENFTRISLLKDRQRCEMYFSNCSPDDAEVYEGWISRGYGHRQKARKVRIRACAKLPFNRCCLIRPIMIK